MVNTAPVAVPVEEEEELHQIGEDTDICNEGDYWHLLPQYIEREMTDGPLNIYRSAFGCGSLTRSKRSSRWGPVVVVVLEILGMLRPQQRSGFMAFNCANATNRLDVYSLLDLAACLSATPHHAVERMIFREIVQIKRASGVCLSSDAG
jgi:hypothetical protein